MTTTMLMNVYLSGVYDLAPYQSPGGQFQVTIKIYDHWTLATKL